MGEEGAGGRRRNSAQGLVQYDVQSKAVVGSTRRPVVVMCFSEQPGEVNTRRSAGSGFGDEKGRSGPGLECAPCPVV